MNYNFMNFRKIFSKKGANNKTWKDIENFDESWKNRMKAMVKYIPDNVSILDLGCGPMWLKEFLKCNEYYPVDYKIRGNDTIICDFNNKEFPDIQTDYAFVAGCLEYVIDYDWFISQISKHTNYCVLSYCCTDQISDSETRRGLKWVNNLSKHQIVKIFDKNNMKLTSEDNYLIYNTIFKFSKIK